MITTDNAWVYPAAYEKAVPDTERARKYGYVDVPDWFPVPTKGYEYKIFGQMNAVMKPKPKLRHVIRFIFHRLRAWRMKREIRKFCKKEK